MTPIHQKGQNMLNVRCITVTALVSSVLKALMRAPSSKPDIPPPFNSNSALYASKGNLAHFLSTTCKALIGKLQPLHSCSPILKSTFQTT